MVFRQEEHPCILWIPSCLDVILERIGNDMKSLSLRKTLVFLGAVAALSLVNAQSALAASEMPKDMSCQEFINLNPKAMTPVAWWMLHEETVYKGGDTVTLNETDLTQIPQVIEYCKKNPEKNLYTFKEKNANVLPN